METDQPHAATNVPSLLICLICVKYIYMYRSAVLKPCISFGRKPRKLNWRQIRRRQINRTVFEKGKMRKVKHVDTQKDCGSCPR